MKVLGNNVVCTPAVAPTETAGGLVIPASMGQHYKCRAFIVMVGPEVEGLEAGNEIIFTKADKLTKRKLADNVEAYKQLMLVRWEEMPPYVISSASTGMGQDEILNFIEETNKTVTI